MLRLKFLTFDLYENWSWSPWGCQDYLEISGIKGYADHKRRLCGYEDLYNKSFDFYPIGESVAFKFVSQYSLLRRRTTASGFLLQYEGTNVALIWWFCLAHSVILI